MPDSDGKGWYGSAFWRDISTTAASVNPPGQAGDPDRDTATGLLLFDAGTTELVIVSVEIPAGYIEGQELDPAIRWAKTTSASGNVAWRIRYRYANAGSTMSAWSAGETVSTVHSSVTDSDTAFQHLLTTFSDLAISDAAAGTVFLFEIARLGGDAADTYGADAYFFEFDLHYRVNQPGSVQEYLKYSDDRYYF